MGNLQAYALPTPGAETSQISQSAAQILAQSDMYGNQISDTEFEVMRRYIINTKWYKPDRCLFNLTASHGIKELTAPEFKFFLLLWELKKRWWEMEGQELTWQFFICWITSSGDFGGRHYSNYWGEWTGQPRSQSFIEQIGPHSHSLEISAIIWGLGPFASRLLARFRSVIYDPPGNYKVLANRLTRWRTGRSSWPTIQSLV